MSKIYELYVCKHEGVVLYIGQGAYNRHKHCNSGTSHVYELNRLHFQGVVFDVDVIILKSKEDAVRMEKEYIKRYLPKYNKDFMQNDKQIKGQERALFKATWLSYINKYKMTQARREKLYVIVDEFMTYHTHDMLKEEGLLLRGHGKYTTANLRKLSSVASSLRHHKCIGGMPIIFKDTLEKTYLECYGKPVEITWCIEPKNKIA